MSLIGINLENRSIKYIFMFKKLTVLPLVLIISTASFAQFGIGIKGGANIAKIDGKSFKDEFAYGYLLGAFVEVGKGKISFQPELIFSQTEAKVDSNFKVIYQGAFNSAYNDEIKLNYLSIPVVLNYKLSRSIRLQAGPQFGILMDNNKNLFQNGQEAFDKGDLSMLGGAELKFSRFRITGRYVVGLNNINDIDNKDEWKSQAIQVSLGINL
jgi:hypothetical protein